MKNDGSTKNKKTLLYGKEVIINIGMENFEMTVHYGALWEEHLGGDAEFKKLLKDARDQLVERPSKGDGTGKEGKVGQIPAASS